MRPPTDVDINRMQQSSSVIRIGIAVLGFIAVVLAVRRAFVAKPPELGAMSGQWMAEHRAGPEDRTH